MELSDLEGLILIFFLQTSNKLMYLGTCSKGLEKQHLSKLLKMPCEVREQVKLLHNLLFPSTNAHDYIKFPSMGLFQECI